MHKTGIEWADYTWNPLTGCKHQCKYCYAERLTKRFSGDIRLNMSVKAPEIYKGVYILDKPFTGSNGQINNFPYGFLPTYHKYRLNWLEELNMGANIFVVCPPRKNRQQKATKNGMNRNNSFVFVEVVAFIPRFT